MGVVFVTAVYLDNSATTCVCRAAADKAYAVMTEIYGNPSSLHSMGFRAEQEMTAASRDREAHRRRARTADLHLGRYRGEQPRHPRVGRGARTRRTAYRHHRGGTFLGVCRVRQVGKTRL